MRLTPLPALVVAALAASTSAAPPASAHDLPYSLARLEVTDGGGFRLEIACHTAALVTGLPQGHLPPEARRGFAAMTDDELARRVQLMTDYLAAATVIAADGRRLATPTPSFPSLAAVREDGAMTVERARTSASIVIEGPLPSRAAAIALAFAPELGTVLLEAGGAAQALAPGERSAPIAVSGRRADQPYATLAQYVRLGVTHILPFGLDHVLFVLALFLLSPRWGPLAWQVTAFTAAHSVTLALAALGLVDLSARPVEALIAASIAAVAVDNLRAVRRAPAGSDALLAPWRPAVVFLFGLLHGLGFAGVLRELGLPPGREAIALAGFNLGIELGQLAVLALAFAALGWTGKRAWRRRWVTVPVSLAIALVAGAWTLERTVALPLSGVGEQLACSTPTSEGTPASLPAPPGTRAPAASRPSAPRTAPAAPRRPASRPHPPPPGRTRLRE